MDQVKELLRRVEPRAVLIIAAAVLGIGFFAIGDNYHNQGTLVWNLLNADIDLNQPCKRPRFDGIPLEEPSIWDCGAAIPFRVLAMITIGVTGLILAAKRVVK